MSYSGHSNPPWQRNSLRGSAPMNMPNLANVQNPINPQNNVVYQNTPLYTGNFRIQHGSSNQNLQHPYSGTVHQLAPSQPYYSQAVPYSSQVSRGLNPITYPTLNRDIHSAGNQQSQQQPHNERITNYNLIERNSHPRMVQRPPLCLQPTFNPNSRNHRTQMMPSRKRAINSIEPYPLNVQAPSMANYNSVTPSNDYARVAIPRKSSPGRRSLEIYTERPSRHRDDDDINRKKRREDKDREKEYLPYKKDQNVEKLPRKSSPKRKTIRYEPRYTVDIPKMSLILTQADVSILKQRYSNLYVPSDFMHCEIHWPSYFKPERSFSITRPCSFYLMQKSAEAPEENTAVLEPPDADYLFSAKVMLMAVPPIATVYQKCLDGVKNHEGKRYTVHPSRMIKFLIGTRNKSESMAIGGPWSPSLDGSNPQDDPNVLIKTAIRTCKALTGINLSACTQWYKFLELHYHRSETTYKGRVIPARVETVVIYLTDANACVPDRAEWGSIQRNYKSILHRSLFESRENKLPATKNLAGHLTDSDSDSANTEPKTEKVDVLDSKEASRAVNFENENSPSITADSEKQAIDHEVSQTDKNKHEKAGSNVMDSNDQNNVEMKSDINDCTIESATSTNQCIPRKLDKEERETLERCYQLPDEPHIVVHPSKTAKHGKFDCDVNSLSVLLAYILKNTKEQSFEVSLFAELFNEMLMRDFGYKIYREIIQMPDKPKKKESQTMKDENDTENIKKVKDIDIQKQDNGREKSNESDRSDKTFIKDDRKPSKKHSDDTDDDNLSVKSGDKRKKIKTVIVKPELLLSLVYFDINHYGYILDKDLEDLFHVIGLNLSRGQVRKLVSKVISKDAFMYKKLTHAKTEIQDQMSTAEMQGSDQSSKDLVESAQVTDPILPFVQSPFEDNSDKIGIDSKLIENGKSMIMYNGVMLDIDKLLEHTKRLEKIRGDCEKDLKTLQEKNIDLHKLNTNYLEKIEILKINTRDQNRKISTNIDSIIEINKKKDDYYKALVDIHNRASPFVEKAHRSNVSRDRGKEKQREQEPDADKEDLKTTKCTDGV